MRCSKGEDVELALLIWINEARTQNLILAGGILQEKAKTFAGVFHDGEFSTSSGWLQRFKEMHANVDTKIATYFLIDQMPSILNNFQESDIFNADEFGLLSRCLPS